VPTFSQNLVFPKLATDGVGERKALVSPVLINFCTFPNLKRLVQSCFLFFRPRWGSLEIWRGGFRIWRNFVNRMKRCYVKKKFMMCYASVWKKRVAFRIFFISCCYVLLLCVTGIKLTLKCSIRFTKFLPIRNPRQISSNFPRGPKKRKQFCINLFRFAKVLGLIRTGEVSAFRSPTTSVVKVGKSI